jgi:NifB/MoaA-like Fe-S oxidoreductase
MDGYRKCVVLDRVRPDWTPPYCVHGRATCVRCGLWVYLGDKTHREVAGGNTSPLCMECAVEILPYGSVPDGRLNDHHREDGPHG